VVLSLSKIHGSCSGLNLRSPPDAAVADAVLTQKTTQLRVSAESHFGVTTRFAQKCTLRGLSSNGTETGIAERVNDFDTAGFRI
jgi:hypothetical protein